jgi:hypothetical protein
MKATRSGSEVELWINSLKRKKSKNKQASNPDDPNTIQSIFGGINDDRTTLSSFYSPESDIFNTHDHTREQQQGQLIRSLEQFIESLNDGACSDYEFLFDDSLSQEDLLKAIQTKQQLLQAQQVQILREIMLVQQEIFL